MRVGINGMGRIGRLALRAAMGAAHRPVDDPRAGNRLEVVHLNEIKGGAAATAHLLQFDSMQGRWREEIAAESHDAITIIHDPTNTNVMVDAPHKDLRRARSASVDGLSTLVSLILGFLFLSAIELGWSSVHSYLILAYAGSEKAAEDVGFYYAANAAGRFLGTLLSGVLYQIGGLGACLTGSALMLATCWLATRALPVTLEARPVRG